MKLWMRERDQLIEQTMAFVEGVAAARGAAKAPLQVTPARAPEPARPIELPRAAAFVAPASERAEIERRVAKFKAQQEKIRREREASYHEIFSKTRPAEGNAARA